MSTKIACWAICLIGLTGVTYEVTPVGSSEIVEERTPVAAEPNSPSPTEATASPSYSCCTPGGEVRAACVTDELFCGSGFTVAVDVKLTCDSDATNSSCCYAFRVYVEHVDPNNQITNLDTYITGRYYQCGQNDLDFQGIYFDSACFNNGPGDYGITVQYLAPGCPCDFEHAELTATAFAAVTVF